jgi:hypothetical protein
MGAAAAACAEQAFMSGSSYTGGWERGRLQGRGLYAWASGAQYEGTFQSNQITGTGVRTLASLLQPQAKKRKQAVAAQRRAMSQVFTWPGVATYAGEVQGGLPQGVGTMTLAGRPDEAACAADASGDGCGGGGQALSGAAAGAAHETATYDGQWLAGERHGYGRLRYAGGGEYAGAWRHGLPHGVGRMAYASGGVYHGEWARGARHGRGRMAWAGARACYAGDWRARRQQGLGEHMWLAPAPAPPVRDGAGRNNGFLLMHNRCARFHRQRWRTAVCYMREV